MKKINFSSSKISKALSGKGFYVALCLSVVAVGTAAYVAYSSTVSKLTKDPQLSFPDTTSPSASEWNFGQVNKPEDDVPMDAETDGTEVAAQPFVMPLNGEIINPYSYGELVKCSTTGVWKTHDGVDIKGDLGAEIKSMTGGTVTQIYEDPLWGVCIIIDHGNGYEGHYYNLNKVLPVKVGDTVSAGTIIGAIGDTAEIELAEPSHLHFGLKLNGNWTDPIMTINPGK
ncbi:MAG: M23 family metallopeptidase [Oscillospiraceae bacterium]